MREKLKAIGSKTRQTYTANYAGVGFKITYKDHYLPTLLLKDVKHDGTVVAGHLWVNYTKGFSKLGELKDGDVIQFNGRVNSYQKGYYTEKKQLDYELQRPTKIKLLNRQVEENSLPDALKEKNTLIGYIMLTNLEFYQKNNRPVEQWYIDQFKDWRKAKKKKA